MLIRFICVHIIKQGSGQQQYESTILGRLVWERKTYTKMDQIRFFVFFDLMGMRMVQIRIYSQIRLSVS